MASAIAVKTARAERCEIASLAPPAARFDPHAEIVTKEDIVFKGCTVTVPRNPVTGEGEVATIRGANCVFVANADPVSSASLRVNGANVGNVKFGDGYLSTGTSSCTTKVVGNSLYTWCTCGDTNGDKVPEDPIPPCPVRLP
jgi:hypothetical protein